MLGLGWACTPAGLKAMEELAKLETERGNRSIWTKKANGLNMANSALFRNVYSTEKQLSEKPLHSGKRQSAEAFLI